MLVKSINFYESLNAYEITGYCGHSVFIAARVWQNTQNTRTSLLQCKNCEDEYKLVEHMLHILYLRKIRQEINDAQ